MLGQLHQETLPLYHYHYCLNTNMNNDYNNNIVEMIMKLIMIRIIMLRNKNDEHFNDIKNDNCNDIKNDNSNILLHS